MAGLPCPSCGQDSEVIDSRMSHLWHEPAIRRRRVCKGCSHRWTTFESAATTGPDLDRGIEHVQRTIAETVATLQRLYGTLEKPT